MVSYVYIVTNAANGKVYVGKSNNPTRRWKAHVYSAFKRSTSQSLYRAMRRYGVDKFSMRVLSEHPTEGEAFLAEERSITELKATDGRYGYNHVAGGLGGLRPNEETRLKLVLARTGSRRSEETKARMSIAQKGLRLGTRRPEDVRAKIGAGLTGRRVSEETRAKIASAHLGIAKGPMSSAGKAAVSAVHKGRRHSPEHREKIRMALVGQKRSDDVRAKMSRSAQGRRHSEEWKANMSAKMTGRTYTPEQLEKYRAAASLREAKKRCILWFCRVMAGVEQAA